MIDPEQERIEAIGEQLRQKIASKFTASTFLAGFALAVLTGQVFALWQSSHLPITFPLSIAIVFGAFILFVEAIVRLDELTMPKRFWEEDTQVNTTGLPSRWGYLTDDDLWNLQKQMIFYWQRLTIVATAFTVVAVIAMLLPFGMQEANEARQWSFASAGLGLLLAAVYCLWIRKAVRKKYPALMRPVD